MALLESYSFSEFGVDPGNRDVGSEASPSSLVLLGKFLSSKPPSRHTITAVLKRAWESFEGWTMVELEKGTFQFSFKLAKDRDNALARRPWTIRGALLLLERWPAHLQLEEIHFSSCPVWIRLSGLPPAMLADSPLSRIARLFGEVAERRVGKEAKFAASARFRAVINVSQALKPGFFLDRPNLPSIWIQAQYENIGNCCFRCGLLGHGASDCLAEAEILVAKVGFPEVPLYGEWIAVGSTVATCFTNGGRPRSSPKAAQSISNGPAIPTVDVPPEVRTPSSVPSRQGRPVAAPRKRTGEQCDPDTATLGHTTILREKGNSALSSFGDSSCQEVVDLARRPTRVTKSRPKKPKRKISGYSEIEPRTDPLPEVTALAGYSGLGDQTLGVPRGSSSPDPLILDAPREAPPLEMGTLGAPRGTPPPGATLIHAPRGIPPPKDRAPSTPRGASSPEVLLLGATRGTPIPREQNRSPIIDGAPRSSGRGKRQRTLEPCSPGSADQSRSSLRPSPILTRSSSRLDNSRNSPQTLISAARALRAVRTP